MANAPIIWNGNTGKMLAAQLIVQDGTVSLPSMSFINEPSSGIYRIAASNIAIAVAGTKGLDMKNIGSSLVNFGFGTAPNAGSTVPFVADRSTNAVVFYNWGNSSTGTSSGTVFQVQNGTGSNYTTIENYNGTTAGYMAGGSGFFGGVNQLFTVLGSEFASSNIRFTVGGRTLATERMRLNTTDLTLNAGTAFKMNGATSGTLTKAVPATVTSYTQTEPAAQATAYRQTKVNDSAGNMSWTDLGRINKNYIGYPDFENNATTGWSATGCATVTNGLPVSVGSGGAAFSSANGGRAKGANTNAPAIDSSSAIRGTYALNLATTGAGVIGDGYISDAVTIDKADQAKVLSFKIYYKVAAGTPVMGGTSADTYAVAVYDIVNNAWLGMAGAFSFNQSSGVGIASGTVQTASNTTGVQLFIYSPVAPTGTSSLLIDDVYLGPQTAPIGAPQTDWTAYTPTGTWTTNVAYTGAWRRVGQNIQLNIKMAFSGAPGGANTSDPQVTIPSGLTIDTSKIVFTSGASLLSFLPGAGTATLAGSAFFNLNPYVSSTATTSVSIGALASLATFTGTQYPVDAATTASVPFTFAAGASIQFSCEVPVVGWSSNVQMSSDTDTRVVAMQVNQAAPTATITASLSLVKFTSGVVNDTHGAFSTSTGLYTVPVSGYYRCSVNLAVANTYAANGNAQVGFLKNGVSIGPIGAFLVTAAGANTAFPYFSYSFFCNAGDTIGPVAAVNSASAASISSNGVNYFSVERLSGPAVVAATESVNARYFACATAISGALATLSWTTKDFDSHNAMSAGTYTVPVAGKYQINVAVALTAASAAAGNAADVQIQKNGTVVSEFAPVYQSTQVLLPVVVDDIISCLAGDTIRVQVSSAATTPSIVSSNSKNFISIARVGN